MQFSEPIEQIFAATAWARRKDSSFRWVLLGGAGAALAGWNLMQGPFSDEERMLIAVGALVVVFAAAMLARAWRANLDSERAVVAGPGVVWLYLIDGGGTWTVHVLTDKGQSALLTVPGRSQEDAKRALLALAALHPEALVGRFSNGLKHTYDKSPAAFLTTVQSRAHGGA